MVGVRNTRDSGVRGRHCPHCRELEPAPPAPSWPRTGLAWSSSRDCILSGHSSWLLRAILLNFRAPRPPLVRGPQPPRCLGSSVGPERPPAGPSQQLNASAQGNSFSPQTGSDPAIPPAQPTLPLALRILSEQPGHPILWQLPRLPPPPPPARGTHLWPHPLCPHWSDTSKAELGKASRSLNVFFQS